MIESPDDFFAKKGPLPPSLNDARRFPRFYFRSCAEAKIYPIGRGQEPEKCFVLTSDISRNGIGLVHDKPLYPGQRIDLVLNGEQPRRVEVVRCRRQPGNSYMVGCRFEKADGP